MQRKIPDWSRYATRVQLFGLSTQVESLTPSRRSLMLFFLVTSVYAIPYVQSQSVIGSDYLTILAPIIGTTQAEWAFTLRFLGKYFDKRSVAG